MKPHLIIKLKPSNSNPKLEYWEDVIEKKKGLSKKLIPSIDKILKKYNIDFISTQNYKSQKRNWNSKEIGIGLNRIYRLVLLKNRTNIPKELMDEIKYLPTVSFISKGNLSITNLPSHQYVKSKSLNNYYVNNSIYLEQAHQITKGDSNIKIAILDTGINTEHSEFANSSVNKFAYAKDFVNIINGASRFIGDYLDMDNIPDDQVGHGTHVAGIIGSYGIKMPLGVAPKATIMPIKVLGALNNNGRIVGAGLIDNINTGIKYAVDNGADVINMSLGVKHEGGGLPHKDVIEYALQNNVTIIAASGNDGQQELYYPSALKGVIAVGASDDNGNIAHFSTFGKHVSVIAPGVNIYSSFLNNGYAMSSGTSQASPYVSGIVALLKSYALKVGKKLDNDLIKKILVSTTDKFTSKYKDNKSGYGRINALDALKMLKYNL